VSAHQRDLADDGLDPAVHRGDDEDVTAGVAAAPHADALRVHLGQGARVGDGVPVVPDLRPRVDLLAGLAVAGPEVTVVVDERVQARRGEDLGVVVEVHLLDRRVAVCHDDGRSRRTRPVGGVEPASQGDALGVELDVSASHASS
jgi:hypothetical protein